ncbi:hypothetical protein QQS21_012215 [Conoideocrella luteorostrata]|uniref:Extracellular mutant protein 11 C-terminal domain-containing protein n=1 Tax=Conoideocrella luteorostrata TaxID=1105319 RepID=A0AAJ0CBL1_9HYPO|nr:hypothetical protein QQS21_012215 [Conoideocrella luteorostrata]
MQPGLKAKGRGLQVFARGKSDSNAHYNASAERPSQIEQERRSTTPNPGEYNPSRQEIAEFARLPIPVAAPKPIGSPRAAGQLRGVQRLGSPARHGYVSPKRQPMESQVQSTEGRHDIFSGSQLGENFMKSGLTTPVNEPEVAAVRQPPEVKTEAQRPEQNRIQRFPPRPVASMDTEKHQFSVEPDGRISVVPGFHRHNPSLMNDGFYNNDVQYRSKAARTANLAFNYPAAALQGQPRLPMRGARINRDRGQPSLPTALTLQEDEVKDRFVEIDDGEKWEGRAMEKVNEPILVRDSDDEFDGFGGFGGFGERPPTPKSKKHTGFNTRPAQGDKKSNKFIRIAPPKDKKRRRQSLDYDDKILSSMTYQDLQEEPFDVVPQLPKMNGHDSASSKLGSRLEQFQQQGEREQHQFFTRMSIEEWEDSGDWFTRQFAGIMGRLRQARRDKRKMIQIFEDEASQREADIRLRSDTIDKKMTKMKQDGQKVVGDKTL